MVSSKRLGLGSVSVTQYLAVLWEGRLGYRMPSKDSDRARNLLNIKWLQLSLSGPDRYDRRPKAPMDVKFHLEIGIPHTMIEVMNHIKVMLKPTG